MSEEKQSVTCPGCGKGYRWQASLAGRKVPCKQCGTKFTIPNAPGEGIPLQPEPVSEDVGYELDIDEPADAPTEHAAPANNDKCPSCNSPVRPGAVLCMNCGFNMQAGEKVQTDVAAGPASPAEDEPPSDRLSRRHQRDMETAAQTHKEYVWQEYKLPIVLMCIGFVFVLINALGLTPAVNDMINSKGGFGWSSNKTAIVAYIVTFALTLVMMLPLLPGGIFFMATVFGSAFGNLFTALLKLFALTVFVASLDHMVDLLMDLATGGFGFIGWGVRLSVVLAAFYPICIKLFDMESHEIWVMFLLYVGGPIVIGMLALMIAMRFI